MGESMAARYWCHMCSQLVNPITEVELKCPHCDSGFVEEVDGREDVDDQTLSPWAPILLRMLGGGSLRRRRIHREVERESSDREVEAFRRRRRRTPAMLQMLHALREGNRSEPGRIDVEREHGRGTEHVILINPFAQALILQGSSDADQLQGPGLELLLQHLAENDPDRYGTPPALKEAVDAMPTVRIEKNTSCSICLEDLEVGGEATEMPCKHKFHGGCILPWLKLHSSCPVCRFQMPADGPKATSAGGSGNRAAVGDGRSVPWPLDGFFPLSASRSSSNSSSSPPPSSSTSGSSSQPNEN
ncbi:E3 ubiquitin-protein ligase SIRP1 [Musa acuminata AAA Group]|uniref:E3 ubiquitin-protein ligase SIRP1 n=1 Tax=Musa acuminata AAA Group TaxID=214697 RepID=UPI0031CF026A